MQPAEQRADRAPRRLAPSSDRLTPRERQVAALVAEGLSNADIAKRLVLEPGTVANHIAHIMRALRMRSRVQVAVWAVEQGLYRSDWDEPTHRALWQGRSVGDRPDAERTNNRSADGDGGPGT